MIDTKIVTLHSGMCYHPIPFSGYGHVTPQRTDCPERYETMKKHYDFKGKTILDVGSSLCYFGFRALQDGAKEVTAVDTDSNVRLFVAQVAKEEKMNLKIISYLPEDHYDVGIYMDTHHAPGTEGYIEQIAKQVDFLFTSAANDSAGYYERLKKLFKNIKPIYEGQIEQRILYQCF